MADDLSAGDWETPHIDVTPYDLSSTTATLTVHSPTDTTAAGTGVPVAAGVEMVGDDGAPFLRVAAAAPVQYPVGGWWVKHWDVAGPGAGEVDDQFFVAPSPLAGGPVWTPTRSRVAAYVPRRTLVEADNGYGILARTFDGSTHPDGRTVDLLIADSVRWVTDRTGDLHATLAESATGITARHTAAYVELGYPDRDADVRIAEVLLRQLEGELKALATRNRSLTGDDPDDPDIGGVFAAGSMWTGPSSELAW